MKKIHRPAVFLAFLASFIAPFVAEAQTGINVPYLKSYSDAITGVINYVIVPVLMAVALLVFFWGVYKYFIQGAASDTERETGRQFVLWGIIGFVVIVSVWGIVYIFMTTLGLNAGTAAPTAPTFNSP